MRIYFHFLYLSILTVVWCGFYYWQTTKTNGWWKNGHSLGAVNLAQVMQINEKCMKAIKKGYSDYPNRQSEEYYGRSSIVMKWVKNAMEEIPTLDEKQFWTYRTDHYQFLISQVDNDPTAVHSIQSAFSPNKEEDKWAIQFFSANHQALLEDLKLRMALTGASSQLYYTSNISYQGSWDKFLPGILINSPFYVVGEKFDIPVAMCGYKSPPPSFQIISTGLPPFGDGFIGLDTTIQTPGIHCFPCLIRYQDFHTDAVVEIHDTVSLKIFPR